MLSICIIVKNDEKNLDECLAKIKNLEYEIIVIDTGSADNTKNIAMSYTDKVYDFEWCDDFSAARNFAISQASNEFILMIDSDEFIAKFDKNAIEHLIQQNPKSVGRIYRANKFSRNDLQYIGYEYVNRLFSKEKYYYEGIIHEQIVSLEKLQYSTYLLPLSVDHVGYSGNIHDRIQKAERNINLLLRQIEEKGTDPYLLYQLGKGYYYKENFEEAAKYFSMATEFDLNPQLEYVSDLVETYGYALLNSKQTKSALALDSVYKEFSYSADFVFMMALVFMNNEYFDRAIEEFIKVLSYKECKMEGVNSYLASYNIGVIYECLGKIEAALHYYKKSGTYSLAQEGIKRCVANYNYSNML